MELLVTRLANLGVDNGYALILLEPRRHLMSKAFPVKRFSCRKDLHCVIAGEHSASQRRRLWARTARRRSLRLRRSASRCLRLRFTEGFSKKRRRLSSL